MNVLFAPDWRDGVPYQRLLAEALEARGVEIGFLRDYRRILPLTRLVRERARQKPVDVLHLHWPEAYYPRMHDRLDAFRGARFPLDLTLARRGRAYVLTAHNLRAHNRAEELFAARNSQESFSQAQRIIAHSAAAREEIVKVFGVPHEKIAVIPHGDLSVSLGAPLERGAARRALGLEDKPAVLLFGMVEPYKGIEEILDCWRTQQPAAQLYIVGKPMTPEYATTLARRAEGVAGVHFRPGWLPDEALRQWLSAADAVLFNYRTIFTSGAASLARSYGVPLLLPRRLHTVDLAEPSPRVHRFADPITDLPSQLANALSTPPDYHSAADWRTATAWPRIAEATERVYQEALRKSE